MARKREPKYRILAYDGDYKSRNLIPSATYGHRIQEGYDKKDEVLKRAEEWLAKFPPQQRWGGSEPYLEITGPHGDREALWKAKDGVWVEQYNHLRKRKRNVAQLKQSLLPP